MATTAAARPRAPRPYHLAALERVAGAPVNARRLGVSGTAFVQMRDAGLTEHQADVVALRVGLHPGEVWEQWWQVDDVDDQAAPDEEEDARAC